MGSEMEPLLLAWSYFRRRKFQLCAELCTQMLEKSPYDQVPPGPRQPMDLGIEAQGFGGSLAPGRGVWEEGSRLDSQYGPPTRHAWSETPSNRGWRVSILCVLYLDCSLCKLQHPFSCSIPELGP